MKLMMYGMPIMFFFVLYDVPSGLLLYWIVSNVLTIAQQMVINDMLKKHKLAAATAPSGQSFQGSNGSMKSAGKTTVRGNAPAAEAGFGDKVKGWLEKKAAEATKTANTAKTVDTKGSSSSPRKGGSDKPAGKKR